MPNAIDQPRRFSRPIAVVGAVEGQREHAILGDPADDPDAGGAGPVFAPAPDSARRRAGRPG